MARQLNQRVYLILFLWLFLVGLSYGDKGCSEPLGLESGKVPNSAMTASSMWDKKHAPYFGRLNMPRRDGHVGSWSSRFNANGQWLQVDFGTTVDVTKIATQGRADLDQWVKLYAIAYSYNLSAWQFYQDGMPLQGNRDRNTVVSHLLSPTIRAQYIRIYPRYWANHISMRLELFGCPAPPGNCSGRFPNHNYRGCCSSSNKCPAGHGICTSDDDCQNGTACYNFCFILPGFKLGDRCCMPEDWKVETTDCSGTKEWTSYWKCCSPSNRCPEDHGDCDKDDDCREGLKCGFNNCPAKKGFLTGDDCCQK